MKTKSRLYELMNKKGPTTEGGIPKDFQEIIPIQVGKEKITAILNWKNGYLNSEENIPAVQFEDFHTEYWENGLLSNKRTDAEGNLMPAVISDYGTYFEYWIDGKRVK